jgi:mono/diheme cytochrome c family protein
VSQLFATTCGWCHTSAGRVAGKGPKLMDTQRSDDFIRNRIKNGKEGAMPAFGSIFSDADIDAIIKYIRGLKPENG